LRISLLQYLVCPRCRAELRADLGAAEPDGHHLAGRLICGGCGQEYPVIAGVPRMVVTAQEHGGAAETFGFEWRKHGEKQLEPDTVFGRTQEQDVAYFLDALHVTPDAVGGAVVLDAGCGSGQLTAGIGGLDAQAVIGVDVNTAIEFPFRRCRALPNVHIVQADIFALPFRPAQFDLVWCNGVIHHTAHPPRAFRALATLVRPGGKLYVWVYEKRWNPFRFTKDVLDALGLQRVPRPVLLGACKAISVPSLLLHTAYRGVRAVPPLRPRSYAGRKTTRYRSRQEFELTWFDALSPKYDKRYTEAEVSAWFQRLGFGTIRPYPFKVGVCGVKRSG
jgi:SAM-dependent methyltransferase/uncharacterized protein YbaR (Trm112 family)